jgi:UDP-N-acetylmuramyl pentapeptide phosphotransferase/UDP-N-acetylglucosamine-1-phosphate transferase
MAAIGFGAYAVAAWHGGDWVLATFSAATACAALPFLYYNFHPARIFMGDVGSVTLGFLAGAVGIAGWQAGTWPLLFPLLVFSPFIADATLTLLQRVLKREKFWRAHREHYYQKLVRLGLGHRNTALLEYLAMLLGCAAALALLAMSPAMQLATGMTWLAVLLAVAFLIDRSWRRHDARSGDA